MKVNRAPFNLIPQKWAFDPEVGPFVRDVVEMLFQLRGKVGGDSQDVNFLTDAQVAKLEALDETLTYVGLYRGAS